MAKYQLWHFKPHFSLRSKEGRFLSIVLFSKESKMNWVREIKRSIISLQELCWHVCSLAPPKLFLIHFYFIFGKYFENSPAWNNEDWLVIAGSRGSSGFHHRDLSRWSRFDLVWPQDDFDSLLTQYKGGNQKTAKSSFVSRTNNLTKL